MFCAVLLAVGFVVDRRVRAKRAGLERPADTAVRSAKRDAAAQAWNEDPGVGFPPHPHTGEGIGGST